MKKLGLFLLFFFTLIVVRAQDIVVIKHTNYTTHFSKSKRYPVLVEWTTTKEMVGAQLH